MNVRLGYWEVQVQALAGDVMAGGGGVPVAGPAQSISHQPPGAETATPSLT